jgi:hypothetical protein
MNEHQKGIVRYGPYIIPVSIVTLSMLLWVALWLNGGVSDGRVRIILLVTPILAIATLLQLFGLFMCDLVSPEQRVRLIVIDLASLLLVGCVIVAGIYLFPEAFDWVRSCRLRNGIPAI